MKKRFIHEIAAVLLLAVICAGMYLYSTNRMTTAFAVAISAVIAITLIFTLKTYTAKNPSGDGKENPEATPKLNKGTVKFIAIMIFGMVALILSTMYK